MKHKVARLIYKCLVRYCKSHDEYCTGCIFNSSRPRCGCIANIPTEWDEAKGE
jgi:hypothetical protein